MNGLGRHQLESGILSSSELEAVRNSRAVFGGRLLLRGNG
jgi:hypothetical protein